MQNQAGIVVAVESSKAALVKKLEVCNLRWNRIEAIRLELALDGGKAFIELSNRLGRNGRPASIDEVLKYLKKQNVSISRSSLGEWKQMAESEDVLLAHFGGGFGYTEAREYLRSRNREAEDDWVPDDEPADEENQEADQEQAKDTSQGVAQDQPETASDEEADTTTAEVPPPEAFEENPAFPRDYTITLTSQDELPDVLAALEKGTYGVSANGNRIAIYQKGCPKIVRAKGSFTAGKAQDVAEKPAMEVS